MSWLLSRIADARNPGSLAARFRRARFESFRQLLAVSERDTILDIGGAPEVWLGTGLEARVTLLNRAFRERPGPFSYITGDAREMHQIADGAFDVAFSNSVIEHVGSFADQQRAAAEIRRVAHRYWVQTPNRDFVLEPHFLFPWFERLPPAFKRVVAVRWPYSFFRRQGVLPVDILRELESLRLLDRDELAQLFVDGSIREETALGMVKSLIAFRV